MSAYIVAFVVCVTFAAAETARKPIPAPTNVNLTIGSEFTFECKTADFPQIWIYSAQYLPISSTQKECLLMPKLEGCWPNMVITHQCGGREKSCQLKVAQPQKPAGCTADFYLAVRWQCTIPRPASNPKIRFGELVPELDDPACEKYYSRQD